MGLDRAAANEALDRGKPRLISTLSVVERDGSTQRNLLVYCPMVRRTVSVERCVACPECARLDASDGAFGRPTVDCTFEGPAAKVAGCALARFAVCVRSDAVDRASMPSLAPGAAMAVVDEDLRFVGVLEPGPHIRADGEALGLAVDERTPLPTALAHMARRHVRRVPVLNEGGAVVGTLDDLDALRALRA